MKQALLLLIILCCTACGEIKVQPHNAATQQPQLSRDALITSDGTKLPMQSWLPKSAPKAVIIALHGMNDYSHAFSMPGEVMKGQGIAVYAYDQRGFGASDNKGIWPGEANLVSDLQDMITATRKLYPHTKLYVLGESMGGAVTVTAFSKARPPEVDGIILSAPAVWGGGAMNPLYHASLWLFAHAMPDKILTGEGLHIMASDNIPMLRELGRDPLVQKGTRMDSVLGLVRLMDKGYAHIAKLRIPVLVLYGKNDQVIPPEAILGSLHTRPESMDMAYYPQGYHLLLRDLGRDLPTRDIVGWIEGAHTLPSGFDADARAWLGEYAQRLKTSPYVHSKMK